MQKRKKETKIEKLANRCIENLKNENEKFFKNEQKKGTTLKSEETKCSMISQVEFSLVLCR